MREGTGQSWRRTASLIVSYAIALHLLTGLRPWSLLSWLAPWSRPVLNQADADLWTPMRELVPPDYALAEHFVTTADGYVLRMFSISSAAAANGDGGLGGPPVLMQHALMDSSAGWLLLGPRRSLALQLADAGFSVWLANSRGNRFSRNHTRLASSDAAFWHFTWADMAAHDLPALINHTLHHTAHQQLVYIGYSQGTTIGLAALASSVHVRQRVSLAVLLAPVAIVANLWSPPFLVGSLAHTDVLAESVLGFSEWGAFRRSSPESWGMRRACGAAPALCRLWLEALCGAGPAGHIAEEVLAVLYGHLPCGTSVRNMRLWAQNIRRRSRAHMHAYDYGAACTGGGGEGGGAPTCNREAYGFDAPPAYNFTAIDTPLGLFTGGADSLSVPADVALLKQQLSRGVVVAHHHEPTYAHLDWELGSGTPLTVYPQVVALAVRFAPSRGAGGAAAAHRVSCPAPGSGA